MQNLGHFVSEANQGYRSGLLAAKADDALSPVNILGFEVSQIGLRRAQVPGQLALRLGQIDSDVLVSMRQQARANLSYVERKFC